MLLGGRRGQTAIRIEGRPYTTIETNLVKRMIEVVLADAELAFRPLSPVKFNIDRLETNPRFAAISRPANAAILVRLRIDMEDRGGNIELLLPYATIEPIRDVLLQMFMGEKFGRDPTWEGHLATEIGQAEIAVDAVLYEAKLPLKQIMKLDVGDTLMLEMKSDAPVIVRCGDVTLTEGRMGRVGDRVAVRVPSRCASRARPSPCSKWRAAPATRWRHKVSNGIGMMIESLVAILLVLTIGYCMMLNRRLKLLKADEQSLRATISELVTATEIAERAIAGLKVTVHECDMGLGERLQRAEASPARSIGGSPPARTCCIACRRSSSPAGRPKRRSRRTTTPRRSPPPRKPSPSGCAPRCTVSRHDELYSRSASHSDRADRQRLPAGVEGGRSVARRRLAHCRRRHAEDGTTPRSSAPPRSSRMPSRRSCRGRSRCSTSPTAAARPRAPVVASLPADRTNLDITGSVPAETADKDKQAKPTRSPTQNRRRPSRRRTVIPTEPGQPSGAERAILERLQERRQELDTRARELDIRESLIKAAEKRMDAQLAELKAIEARITVATQQKDDAEAARLKGLVTMYENMKPRDAAKIFDRLDAGVLLDVASKINPRNMAEILAQMSPDAAQRLTVELASQAQQVKQSGSPGDLPKDPGPAGRALDDKPPQEPHRRFANAVSTVRRACSSASGFF